MELNPVRWFFPKIPEPTALDIAIRQLQQAECDRLTAAADREYHVMKERMYNERVDRLRKDIIKMVRERDAPRLQDGDCPEGSEKALLDRLNRV